MTTDEREEIDFAPDVRDLERDGFLECFIDPDGQARRRLTEKGRRLIRRYPTSTNAWAYELADFIFNEHLDGASKEKAARLYDRLYDQCLAEAFRILEAKLA